MKTLKIENITLPGNLVLSPMAGITDAPFRDIARRFGADYSISEMISSDIKIWNSKKTQHRLKSHFEEFPKIIQIAGAVSEVVVEAAIKCVEVKADIIEINMGCPAKKVCNVLAGSALLKDEKLVANILSEAVKAVKIPVILKTRLGWDHENKNIINIAKIAEDAGIKSLTIHGRTRSDLYNGNVNYDLIAEVKQLLRIPVFANGDINTPEQAKQVIDYTSVDGLYIGRGSLGKPWLFNQIKEYLLTNKYSELNSISKFAEILLYHLNLIYNHYGDLLGVQIARKHLKWYFNKNVDLLKLNICQWLAEFNALQTKEQQRIKIFNLNQC